MVCDVRFGSKADNTGIQGTTGKWVSNVLLISITFSLVKPPPRRYRLSVSTCAESLPTEKFLILQNRNRPTVKSYFYPAGATVKFYFLRKLDAAYLPHDHLQGAVGRGSALLVVCCLMDLPLAKCPTRRKIDDQHLLSHSFD
jgi:hypothetical protein